MVAIRKDCKLKKGHGTQKENYEKRVKQSREGALKTPDSQVRWHCWAAANLEMHYLRCQLPSKAPLLFEAADNSAMLPRPQTLCLAPHERVCCNAWPQTSLDSLICWPSCFCSLFFLFPTITFGLRLNFGEKDLKTLIRWALSSVLAFDNFVLERALQKPAQTHALCAWDVPYWVLIASFSCRSVLAIFGLERKLSHQLTTNFLPFYLRPCFLPCFLFLVSNNIEIERNRRETRRTHRQTKGKRKGQNGRNSAFDAIPLRRLSFTLETKNKLAHRIMSSAFCCDLSRFTSF